MVTIDGLRGLAATVVVLFHLHGAISRTASGWLWAPIDWIARNGFLGVDIFFVISGFVIALSVSKGAPTFGYFGRFIVRRSIRLDPPYWSSILLEVLLLHLSLRLFSGLRCHAPDGSAARGAPLLRPGDCWGTAASCPSSGRSATRSSSTPSSSALVVLQAKLPGQVPAADPGPTLFCAALFAVSLWTRYWPPAGLPHGLAIDRWFQFFIGALTWRAVSAPGRMRAAPGGLGGARRGDDRGGAPAIQILPIVVSAWLVLAARDSRWGWLTATRPFRFLGAISYSLYLYHSSVGWRFVSLVQRELPGPWSPPMAVSVFIAGITFSIGFATMMWWFIERPCLKLCQRVRLPRHLDARIAPNPAAAPASI